MSERVLGTAQEEFDIATGYHRQVVRLKDENEQLEERHRQMEAKLSEALHQAIEDVRSNYPEDVFLADSNSPDAKAAKMARLICDQIERHYERLAEKLDARETEAEEGEA